AALHGSERPTRKLNAKGFLGNATAATARYFGRSDGMGTMPHALIGYAGSTVRAAEMMRETYPNDGLTVLVDYFGREITDSIACARRFPHLPPAAPLPLRLHTPATPYAH